MPQPHLPLSCAGGLPAFGLLSLRFLPLPRGVSPYHKPLREHPEGERLKSSVLHYRTASYDFGVLVGPLSLQATQLSRVKDWDFPPTEG